MSAAPHAGWSRSVVLERHPRPSAHFPPPDIREFAAGMRLLSEREREIARGAGSGLTNPEIGDALYISVQTVKNHLWAVYRSLGITGELAVKRAKLAYLCGAWDERHDGGVRDDL